MSHRTQFKIDPDQDIPLEVALVLPPLAPLEGRLQSVETEGARVRFDAATCPALTLGEKVQLRFSAPGLKSTVVISASLQLRRDDDATRDYGFWFSNPREVEEKLFPRLQGIFNRRGAVRVQPDPKLPVVVTLENQHRGLRVHAPLIDISGTGMSVRVATKDEAALVETSRAVASLMLPGDRQPPLFLGVRLRERRLYSTHIHIGLEFEAARTDSFGRQQEAILEYVLARQMHTSPKRKAG